MIGIGYFKMQLSHIAVVMNKSNRGEINDT